MDPSSVVAPIAKTAATSGAGLGRRLTWRWRLALAATRQLDKPRPWRSVASWLKRNDVAASLDQTHVAPTSMATQLDRHLTAADPKWAALPKQARAHRAQLIIRELHRQVPIVRSEQAAAILGQRQVAMVGQVTAGQETLTAEVAHIGTAVTGLANGDDEALFQERLLLLPPHRRGELTQTRRSDRDATRQLTLSLTDPMVQPHAVLIEWDQHLPPWLSHAAPEVLLVTAKLSLDYDHPKLGSRLFVLAADAGAIGKHRWIGLAALSRPDDDAAAVALLESLGTPQQSSDPLVRGLYAALTGAWETVEHELAQWKPATPSDWSVFTSLQTRRAFLHGNERAVSAPMLDEAIHHVRRTLTRLPVDLDLRASLLLAEAEYMIMRVALGASRTPVRDLDTVLQRAQEVRDRRRPWRGDSARAVAVATKAAILTGDFEAVLRLGLPGYRQPGSAMLREADVTAQEAAHPDVRRNVLLAQLALSKAPRDPELSGLPPFHEHQLKAMLAEAAGQDAGELWRAAYETTSDDTERAVALLGLAHHGRQPNDIEARSLLAEFPVFAAQVRAAELEAVGDLEAAVEVLQEQVTSSRAAATILGQLFERIGRVDAAVTVYGDAATRFADPELTVLASRVLWRHERRDDAQELIGSVLRTADTTWAGRANALRIAAQIARDRGDEISAADYLKAAVAAEPSHDRARWALVEMHILQGDPVEAQAVFSEGTPPFEPTDASEALTWLRVQLAGSRDQAALTEAVSIARRFPDTEAVQAAIVMLALQPSVELPPSTISDLQHIISSFAERWPTSIYVRRIAIAQDDPADVVRSLELELRPTAERAQARRDLHRKVARGRLPLGLLALDAGRSYTEVLLARGLGCISTWHVDPTQRRADQTAAATRNGSRVLLDLSAVLSVQQLEPDVQRLLFNHFPSARITDSSRGDLRRALAVMEQRSTATIGFDEVEQRLTLRETAPEAADELVQIVQDLQDLVRRLVREQDTAPTGQERAREAWHSSFLTAIATGTTLWADDPALREVVRDQGGEAFSTNDLLEHVSREEKLSPARLAEQLQRLLAAGIQIPLSPPLLRACFEAGGSSSEGIARGLSNPALWAEPSRGSQWFTSMLELSAAGTPHKVPSLTYWMARGLAHGQDDPHVIADVAAPLVARALYMVPSATDATPIVQAARRGIHEAHPDPARSIDFLEQTTKLLHSAVGSDVDPHLATLWVSSLFDGLSDEDRRVVRLALLAP